MWQLTLQGTLAHALWVTVHCKYFIMFCNNLVYPKYSVQTIHAFSTFYREKHLILKFLNVLLHFKMSILTVKCQLYFHHKLVSKDWNYYYNCFTKHLPVYIIDVSFVRCVSVWRYHKCSLLCFVFHQHKFKTWWCSVSLLIRPSTLWKVKLFILHHRKNVKTRLKSTTPAIIPSLHACFLLIIRLLQVSLHESASSFLCFVIWCVFYLLPGNNNCFTVTFTVMCINVLCPRE